MKDQEIKGLRLVADHIRRVQGHIQHSVNLLNIRSVLHDQSKYSEDEIGLVLGKSVFDQYEYMSKEERVALATVKDSLVHHYANNSHHPEHYHNGVEGMSLFDLLEMVCDWKAASEMSPNGSFKNSINFNEKRFGLSPEMVKILENTGKELGWI